MDRSYKSSTSLTPPTYPGTPSIGYPQEGNPGTGTPATKPGAWWYYATTEEIRNAIVQLGGTPTGNLVNQLATGLALLAPKASPAFTGNPTAPTQSAADNTTKLATTAFVQTALVGLAPTASPALTGNPTAPTQTAGDNSTKIATTAYVDTALGVKAPLASPALTGNPTAPTQSAADNTTKIATTAFVQTALVGLAPLASPALTGNPTAPTQSQGDNSTKIATTAYVDALKAMKSSAMLVVQQVTTGTTQAGALTASTWTKRALGALKSNTISGASIASSVISLPNGEYMAEIWATAYLANNHVARLRNTSDSTDAVITNYGRSQVTAADNHIVYGKDTFTVTGGPKNFELQHNCETTNAAGQGNPTTNFSINNVFAQVIIHKVGP